MYHYVREYDSSYPNFRFLDIKNFCKQLDYLDKKFGFVEKDEWLSYTNSGILPKKSGSGGYKRLYSKRSMIDAMLYINKTGCQ